MAVQRTEQPVHQSHGNALCSRQERTERSLTKGADMHLVVNGGSTIRGSACICQLLAGMPAHCPHKILNPIADDCCSLLQIMLQQIISGMDQVADTQVLCRAAGRFCLHERAVSSRLSSSKFLPHVQTDLQSFAGSADHILRAS